jgi:hypothetical protein
MLSSIRRLSTVMLLLIPAATAGVFADSAVDHDSLWTTAVELFAANERWIAGSTYLLSEEIKKDGEIKSSETREIRTSVDEDLRLRTEILFVEKNGEDITEEEKRKDEQESADDDDNDNSGGLPSPFDPKLQDRVTAQPTGEYEVINGKRCVIYSFEITGDDEQSYIGSVWIEEATLVPVKLTASISPLPRFVSFITMTVQYTNLPERWVISDVYFEGAGGFLFVKKHFRTKMRFSDYFERPGSAT